MAAVFEEDDNPWRRLGADPGLCGRCRHGRLNETRRGTVYLRCTLAAVDARLPKYPRLPVHACVGFAPVMGPAFEGTAVSDDIES